MVSDYPPHDTAPEAAWREEHDVRYTRTTESTAQLVAAQARLAELQARRSAHLDAAARGEAVAADGHRTVEDEIRAVELDILHVSELLKRRNAMLAEHDKTAMAARAEAHRPRVLHALRELADSHVEKQKASFALHQAGQRDSAAREVINLAWGAGFPVPPSLTPGIGQSFIKLELPPVCDEARLRRIFGDTAIEAFGETKAAPSVSDAA